MLPRWLHVSWLYTMFQYSLVALPSLVYMFLFPSPAGATETTTQGGPPLAFAVSCDWAKVVAKPGEKLISNWIGLGLFLMFIGIPAALIGVWLFHWSRKRHELVSFIYMGFIVLLALAIVPGILATFSSNFCGANG